MLGQISTRRLYKSGVKSGVLAEFGKNATQIMIFISLIYEGGK